jgi:hypothetical protein
VSDSATDILLIHDPVSPEQDEPGSIARRIEVPTRRLLKERR